MQNNFYSQLVYNQEIFQGGVVGVGFSPSFNSVDFEGIFNLPIFPLNSTIKKAYLFSGQIGQIDTFNLQFNGTNLQFNSSTIISNDFISEIYGGNSAIHCYDVTNLVNQNQISYLIKNIDQMNISSKRFSDFYLLIEYFNINSELINNIIVLNNQNFGDDINYNILDINPINKDYDVGLSLFSGYICNDSIDGETILINSVNTGVFGGNNLNSGECGGPTGDFKYDNLSFFGLNGDNSSTIFNNHSVIMKINSFIPENANNINIVYKTNILENKTNSIWINFLNYFSNCSSFNYSHSLDTTLCPNGPLLLFASGGQIYTWLADGSATKAAEVLSCTNCLNPVFTGDKSTLLTVQIWNNDSCSVVRPIKINVRPKPQLKNTTFTPTDCGTSNGKVVLELTNQGVYSFTLDGNTPQYTPVLENLSKGQHLLHIEDEYGCVADTFFNINDTLRTNAKFSFNPNSGYSPLEVNFLQQSTYATNYQWKINENVYTDLSSFTFDSSGLYNVTLYAWQYDESCIDSFSLKIKVYDNFSISIPNIFSPNNDTKNEMFGINVSNEVEITYEIFNRWGNLVARGTHTGKGFVALWDGTTHKMFSNPPPQSPSKGGSRDAIEGTYYYTLSIELKEELLLPDNPSSGILTKNDFPIKEKGWVQVVR
ncbi:MAG: gliding motility-associated C-terminal domain-containing protein [Flavobacteriia bacterium]|nr:gliding motility-associated C-terminal domain-containing protein [Flavobacteriia bacterium]